MKMQTRRIPAIDITRALTMVLMIFVNDLWSLHNIPGWLEHVAYDTDGLGLADVVFPAFLFIVGLSLPYAIDGRRSRGESNRSLILHVLSRTLALLVMGVFLVNGETIHEEATGLSRHVWYTLSCAAFILIWNDYPHAWRRAVVFALRAAGVAVLVLLVVIYRGGSGDELFAPQWWGILGLIGWTYLIAGLVVVFVGDRLAGLIGCWLLFSAISVLSAAGLIPELVRVIPQAISGGTLTALTLGGVVTAVVVKRFHTNQPGRLYGVLVMAVLLLVLLTVLTHPLGGISKLRETPAWLFLCSAFTVLTFGVVYWVTDMRKRPEFFSFIKPAGTATLLCYLIPYFVYALMSALQINYPDFLLSGFVGLMKSLLFALVCVWIAGGLVRLGIRPRL